MLYEIIFSPTGGTSKVTRKLSAAWSCEKKTLDLFRRDYLKKIPVLEQDDVCIISMPVFGGRIPTIAADRLRLIKGNGAKAILVAVFGNRQVEDALVEMEDILEKCGFTVAAGVEAVSEHSLVRKFGAGRPDADDAACLLDFGRKIISKLDTGIISKPQLPGNRPYREFKSSIFPYAEKACIKCGICAIECPAGAIPFGSPWITDSEKCISCLHCIRFCPKSDRIVDPQKLEALAAHLESPCADRKENRLYL